MKDYFPFVEGWVLEYDLEDAYGKGILRWAFRRVERRPGFSRATVEQSIQRGEDAPETFLYTVRKNAKGVWTSAWGREFPLPLKEGLAWRREQSDFLVESLDAKKLVPAGVFKECLELSFVIGGGDGGGGRRFYAPGVGLIYAVSGDEADPYEMSLRRVVREPARVSERAAR